MHHTTQLCRRAVRHTSKSVAVQACCMSAAPYMCFIIAKWHTGQWLNAHEFNVQRHVCITTGRLNE